MKIKNLMKKLWIVAFAAICGLSVTSCKKPGGNGGEEGNKKTPTVYYDNENDALIFSSQPVDKIFNPFFSTSASDSNVIGMTQIGMLGNDSEGNWTYGDNEGVVTKDLQIVTTGTEKEDQKTTYYFVLKNNVRFSDGSYLTIKDVLFNLYVYLDPVYTGSSTIYSTDIVGLKEYRTQVGDPNQQDKFKTQFETKAKSRIDSLVAVSKEILKDTESDLSFEERLSEYATIGNPKYLETYKNVVDDYKKAVEFFSEELEKDYSTAGETKTEEVTFKGQDGKTSYLQCY